MYSLATGAMIPSIGLAWAFRVLGIVSFGVNFVCAMLLRDRNKVLGSSQLAFDVQLFKRVEYLLLLGKSYILPPLHFPIVLTQARLRLVQHASLRRPPLQPRQLRPQHRPNPPPSLHHLRPPKPRPRTRPPTNRLLQRLNRPHKHGHPNDLHLGPLRPNNLDKRPLLWRPNLLRHHRRHRRRHILDYHCTC